jgi:hypothetical protein
MWKATLMFVCLNSFVTKVVSLPVYVNAHQYLLLEVVCCVCGVRLIRGVWFCDIIRVCIKCFFLDGWVCKWNALLYSMFRMIFFSSQNSFVCRSYLFRRLLLGVVLNLMCSVCTASFFPIGLPDSSVSGIVLCSGVVLSCVGKTQRG